MVKDHVHSTFTSAGALSGRSVQPDDKRLLSEKLRVFEHRVLNLEKPAGAGFDDVFCIPTADIPKRLGADPCLQRARPLWRNRISGSAFVIYCMTEGGRTADFRYGTSRNMIVTRWMEVQARSRQRTINLCPSFITRRTTGEEKPSFLGVHALHARICIQMAKLLHYVRPYQKYDIPGD